MGVEPGPNGSNGNPDKRDAQGPCMTLFADWNDWSLGSQWRALNIWVEGTE